MSSKINKYLIIVESPAKCKKIEEYLGKDYKCVASYGHLREIKTLQDIKNYEPNFSLIENKKKTSNNN
jgi:DNA topoisomerase-1